MNTVTGSLGRLINAHMRADPTVRSLLGTANNLDLAQDVRDTLTAAAILQIAANITATQAAVALDTDVLCGALAHPNLAPGARVHLVHRLSKVAHPVAGTGSRKRAHESASATPEAQRVCVDELPIVSEHTDNNDDAEEATDRAVEEVIDSGVVAPAWPLLLPQETRIAGDYVQVVPSIPPAPGCVVSPAIKDGDIAVIRLLWSEPRPVVYWVTTPVSMSDAEAQVGLVLDAARGSRRAQHSGLVVLLFCLEETVSPECAQDWAAAQTMRLADVTGITGAVHVYVHNPRQPTIPATERSHARDAFLTSVFTGTALFTRSA